MRHVVVIISAIFVLVLTPAIAQEYQPGTACGIVGTCDGIPNSPLPPQPRNNSPRDCTQKISDRDGANFDKFDKAQRQYRAAIAAQSTLNEQINDLVAARKLASYADLGLTIAHVAKVSSELILSLESAGGAKIVKVVSTVGALGTAASAEEDRFAALLITLGPIGDKIGIIADSVTAFHDIKESRSALASLSDQLDRMRILLARYKGDTSRYSKMLRDADTKRSLVDAQCAGGSQ